MKYADKTGAKYVAILGESELLTGEVNLKNMADGTVATVKLQNLCTYLKEEKK